MQQKIGVTRVINLVNLQLINNLNSTLFRGNIPTTKGKANKTEVLIMKQMKNIIDIWNMIEKYNLQGWIERDSMVVLLPASEYERLLASVKNQKYIRNLVRYPQEV